MKYRLFAVSQPGIEELTAKELEALGIDGKVVPGGVEFEGGLREMYLTNLCLRSASRLLLRLCSFRAKYFPELIRKAKKCPWSSFITPELPLKVRVTSKGSRLYHTGAIKERLLRALKEALGFEPVLAKYEDEGTSLIVRFEKDVCTLSLNTSGAPLFKRGYRVKEIEAPLRENLAASMVLASGWRGETPLVDPFCGSGTIPIEAALIGTNTPPGLKRDFAFMKWKNFKRALWEEVKEEALSRRRELKVPIYGFDIEPFAVEASRVNARAAGVEGLVEFKNLSFPPISLEEATVVTNPPYGVRLTGNVRLLYRRLGEWVRKSFKRYKLLFLAPYRSLANESFPQAKLLTYFDNGGIKVGLYLAQNY